MKTKPWIPMIALTVLLASACVPSLYPLYTDGDLVTDARLVGAWGSEDTHDDELWTFGPSGNAYRLAIFDDDACTPYEAHLVTLGDFLFLDLTPVKPKFDDGMYAGLLLRMHTFFLITIADDRLELRALDMDKLKGSIQDGVISARLVELDGDSILAEPTAELQKLVIQLAETPGQFGDPEILVRR